jgi:hypothetical protein
MRYASLLSLLTTLIILAGCKATVETLPPNNGHVVIIPGNVSQDYEREPNDTDYYADYIPGFPFYNVDGYCGAYNDTIDKFYFELNRSGTVHLVLNIDDYRRGDLDLTLEDSYYELASSEGYGSREYIDEWLSPGRYYISVFSPYADGGSGYVLTGDFYRGISDVDGQAGPAESITLPLKRVDYSPGTKPLENIS